MTFPHFTLAVSWIPSDIPHHVFKTTGTGSC
jgi:hypothetical protein